MEKFIDTYNKSPESKFGSDIAVFRKGCHVVAQFQGCIHIVWGNSVDGVPWNSWPYIQGHSWGHEDLISLSTFQHCFLHSQAGLLQVIALIAVGFYFISFKTSKPRASPFLCIQQQSHKWASWMLRCSFLIINDIWEYLLICLLIIHSLFFS